jgi:lysyl-tRNA synthetase class 2
MADSDGQENRLIVERRAKLQRLREAGSAYPNDFRRDALADELLAAFESHSAEALAAQPITVSVAGRLMVKRVMGGTSFVKLQDRSGQIQLMLKRDRLGEQPYG